MSADQKEPFTLRWGIMATGWIAEKFTKDLLLDPSTRDVHDIRHRIVAVGSSRSATRAQEFLRTHHIPGSPRAYGSYAALVADPAVDIVYVASPHSHHYQHARLALEAGKAVLCEKAFTTNAAQAETLVRLAREKGLFLMEAVWTRFFPLCAELRGRVRAGEIGEVRRVFADVSRATDVEAEFGRAHRMVNLDLAGGVLLDLGVYALTWVFQFLHHIHLPSPQVPSNPSTTTNTPPAPPTVHAAMMPYAPTGADETTSMLLNFPGRGHGIATASLRVDSNPDSDGSTPTPAIRIQGTRGEIHVHGPAYRPTGYRIIPWVRDGEERSDERASGAHPPTPTTVTMPIPGGGHGMFWEADECARCVRDGKTESEVLGWEESVLVMRTMDEVRRQGGLRYPASVESVDFPLEGFGV